MAEPETPSSAVPAEAPSAAIEARRLLRGAKLATLGTLSRGAPFVSLVTPATAPDLSVLLWLSRLSEHTRALDAEPACALLVAGAAVDENPQTAPRLTLSGLATPIEDGTLKARWLARHPYAAPYAGFADFSLWQISPRAAQMVGGFARAEKLRMAAFLPDPASVAAVAEAEAAILGHCNQDHAAALDAIAAADGAAGAGWRMVAVDVDGFDLAREQTVRRIAFAAPVADAAGVREALVRLAQEARRGTAG